MDETEISDFEIKKQQRQATAIPDQDEDAQAQRQRKARPYDSFTSWQLHHSSETTDTRRQYIPNKDVLIKNGENLAEEENRWFRIRRFCKQYDKVQDM